jgi:hypothetical protein
LPRHPRKSPRRCGRKRPAPAPRPGDGTIADSRQDASLNPVLPRFHDFSYTKPAAWYSGCNPLVSIEAHRCDHVHRLRFKVTMWGDLDRHGVRAGDTIRWNPKDDILRERKPGQAVESIATFTVLSISRRKDGQSMWTVELGRSPPPITVCGVTYPVPAYVHLVAEETLADPPRRFAP